MIKEDEILKEAQGYFHLVKFLMEQDTEESRLYLKLLCKLHANDIVWILAEVAYQYYRQGFISAEDIPAGIVKTYDFIMSKFESHMEDQEGISPDVLKAVMAVVK